MRVIWSSVLVALVAAGCKGEPDNGGQKAEKPVSFPTPWEDAELGDKKVRGAFFAEIDSPHPGVGFFASGPARGQDVVTASVVDVGATWPVLQIRIMGHTADGWDVLELDIAANHWVAGEVPIDGESATGVLTDAEDGEVRYLLGGNSIIVTQPGLEPGQIIEGEFAGISLSEPM